MKDSGNYDFCMAMSLQIPAVVWNVGKEITPMFEM
jgi:hypothetical protein